MPYKNFKNKFYDEDIAVNGQYKVNNIYTAELSNMNKVKELILKYGAVTSGMYLNEEENSYNKKTASINQKYEKDTNHSITIVGWDDNYSKDNFKIKPLNDGAWLIKNSHGTDWGYNGYGWISYEDVPTVTNVCYAYEMDIINEEFNIYQYDGSISTYKLYDVKEYSNIYTANKKESLSEIGFFTFADEEYEICIYKNIRNTPDSGILVYKDELISDSNGYRTIEINKKILLNSSEKFSVIIKKKDLYDCYEYISIDKEDDWDNWFDTYSIAYEGESFIKTINNKEWEDIGLKYNANCKIKAITKEVE